MRTPCPFRVGQTVFYRPNERMRGLNANVSPWSSMQEGSAVRIQAIVNDAFVVIDDEDAANSGLHWSAFQPT